MIDVSSKLLDIEKNIMSGLKNKKKAKKYSKKYPPKLLDSKLPEIDPNIVMFKCPLPIENFEGLATSDYTKKELENLISEAQKEELEEYK